MTKNKLIKVNGTAEGNIESRISFSDLDKRLIEDKKKGSIRGEQWFRDATLWYELAIPHNNPYHHKRVHSELYLLHKEKDKLAEIIANSALIFYGIGIGETEIEIVDWGLERENYTELIGIDVNNKFIRGFIGRLRDKTKENPLYQIMFKGYHALFEQLKPEDFDFENAKYTKRSHICLGNTIGNYSDQGEILRLFSANSQSGDFLVLGFQLDIDIEVLFKKYSTNPKFDRFVLNWETNPNFSQLGWELDRENRIIKAKYKGIDVFRSKKYNPQKLRDFVSDFGYKPISEAIDYDKNACIHVYKKV